RLSKLFYEIRAGKDTMLSSRVRGACQAMCLGSSWQSVAAQPNQRRLTQVKQGRTGHNSGSTI
ncbi:MAG: hypothetical protein MK364_01430, partial [Pirellulales bacterium]|nr:hypothetical protein [Pirellulales bacterium]